MKITDWIRGLLRNGQYRPSYRELQELSEKAKRAAGVYNHEELTRLIRQYMKSDWAIERIALAIAKSEPFINPSSTSNRPSIEMMDALLSTTFMGKHGHRLSDINPEDATPVHGLLAMYTFMRDEELRKFPATGMERPAHDEVISAIRILDCQRQNRDISELCELATYAMLPSEYVRIRYGLGQECGIYDFIERYLTEHEDDVISSEMRRNYARAQTDVCTVAEKAVENIPGVRLPDFYLENLDRELDNLGRIAASPDAVNDLVHITSDFLIKYGIDKQSSPEEQSRQAQKAYCELDARFVKMTGRRPYADGFMASLRQKSCNTKADKAQTQPARSNHIRNPPPAKGKSRKPSF